MANMTKNVFILSNFRSNFSQRLIHKQNSSSCGINIIRRYVAEAAPEEKPQNLFELYQKNSHWMSVYNRHPLVTEKLSVNKLRKQVAKEKQKNISIHLPLFINPREAIWTSDSKRVGAVGKKIGTTTLWTKEGFTHQVTIVQIKDCSVLDAQVSREDGGVDKFTQLLVGACNITDEKYLAGMSHKKMEWYNKLGIFPKQFWTGFQVTKDALLFPGTEITASHFQPGQYLTIKAKTIERGFQGVMKRWGMKGQPASHGQTKTHRKMGATGGGQDPGRIFPKKKMAGHVGGRFRPTPPLKLMRINTKYNLLFIKGPIPGPTGGFCIITDGRNRAYPSEPPAFPTHFDDRDEIEDEDLFADYVCKPTDPSLEFPPFKL